MKFSMTFILGVCLAASLAINLYSCNNQTGSEETKKAKQITPGPEPGFADVLISEKDAKHYIDLFENNRHGKDSTLSRSVWHDRRVVEWLGEYFRTAPDSIDGIRMFMLEYDKFVAPGQKYINQTSIVLVPTHNKTAVWNAFDNVPPPLGLNHGELCPSNCK